SRPAGGNRPDAGGCRAAVGEPVPRHASPRRVYAPVALRVRGWTSLDLVRGRGRGRAASPARPRRADRRGPLRELGAARAPGGPLARIPRLPRAHAREPRCLDRLRGTGAAGLARGAISAVPRAPIAPPRPPRRSIRRSAGVARERGVPRRAGSRARL